MKKLASEIIAGLTKESEKQKEIITNHKIEADFCMIMQDDSMKNIRIMKGDTVFIRKQSTVKNGEIAAIIFEDSNKISLVKYCHDEEKEITILSYENPIYAPIVLQKDKGKNFRIVGKATSFQSELK